LLRFAPSPTSDMNIADLQIALINYIVSKQKNEDLIIRIEDTNVEKNIENKDKEILEILNLFSIQYKYAVHQSDNLKYHTQFAMKFLMDKKAFNCFCSNDALDGDKQKAKKEKKPYSYNNFCENLSDELTIGIEAPFTVRLKKPNNNIKFNDLIQGKVDSSPEEIDSFIILKHDKTPTPTFAAAIDDMLSNISMVIRSQKHISSTSRQIHIRNTIPYETKIEYVHLPAILNKNSKKEDNTSIKFLIDSGYLPVSIANYLVLLCSIPPKDNNGNIIEIFSIEEALTWFDIKKASKLSVEFDISKLNFINKEHLKAMDELRFSKILGFSDKDIGKLAKLYLNECNTINDLKEKINLIFEVKESLNDFENEYKQITDCLINADFINDFNDFKKYIISQTSLNEESLDTPLRYILTGTTNGPDLDKIYPLIKNYLGEIIK